MRQIAEIHYGRRLKEIENGLEVRHLSIFLDDRGDSYIFTGNNVGHNKFDSPSDLLDLFGLAIRVKVFDLDGECFSILEGHTE